MLTPKQLAAVATDLATRYLRTSDALTSLMAGYLVESGALDGDLQGALRTSGGLTTRLLHHIADLSPVTETIVRKATITALSFSTKDDMRAAGRAVAALSSAEQRQLSNSAEAVISQITQLARRDNLAMVEDARRSYIGIVSRYVPQVANGTMSKEQAVSEACKELAERGVCVVDYASGRRDRADVVMRRHITTQIGQTAGQRTMEACERLGVELVEVSSHSGARPSHRHWQGKIYSLHGDKTIGGVKYKDFRTATGYGDIDGLCGVNCRHSFAPYVPGRPKRWSETPDEDLGLDPDKTYELTQKQRALERKVRAAKREIACNNATGTDDTDARLKLGRSQKELRDLLKSNKKALVRDSARERAFDEQGKRVQSRGLTSKKHESGAISDDLSEIKDPETRRRVRHAEKYYESVRNRDEKREIKAVSKSSGLDEETVQKIYKHVFIEEHDLADGHHRFVPDYDMSQSWQRLRSGKEVRPYDITLLKHEEMEADLMAQGYTYEVAHEMTCKAGYNYVLEMLKWQSDNERD